MQLSQSEGKPDSKNKALEVLPSQTRPITLQELRDRLLTLWENSALELVFHEGSLLIPYVFNDAAECYLLLKDCLVQGSSIQEMRAGADGSLGAPAENDRDLTQGPGQEGGAFPALDIFLVQEKERLAILMKVPSGAACSLWFSNCLLVTNLYQYHRILHNWVSGQEHLRRLVYILGTLYEKHSYLLPPEGYTYTSEEEEGLIYLMELSAFRFFRPAAPEYCGSFPNTLRGFQTALSLAKKAGDAPLVRALSSWKRMQRLPFLKSYGERRLRKAFEMAEAFYAYLDQRVTRASLLYPERKYEGRVLELLEKKRREARDYLLSLGFEGRYPDYQKEDVLARVYEEHPFHAPNMDDLEPQFCVLYTQVQHGRTLRRVEQIPSKADGTLPQG